MIEVENSVALAAQKLRKSEIVSQYQMARFGELSDRAVR